MSAQHAIRGYHDGWSSRNLEAARAHLSPKVVFQDPINRFDGADALLAGLGGFLGIFKGYEMVSETYGPDGGVLLYDCATLASPKPLRCSEHFKVEGGRITAIDLVFDSGALKP